MKSAPTVLKTTQKKSNCEEHLRATSSDHQFSELAFFSFDPMGEQAASSFNTEAQQNSFDPAELLLFTRGKCMQPSNKTIIKEIKALFETCILYGHLRVVRAKRSYDHKSRFSFRPVICTILTD